MDDSKRSNVAAAGGAAKSIHADEQVELLYFFIILQIFQSTI
jgi:hypothetical protein